MGDREWRIRREKGTEMGEKEKRTIKIKIKRKREIRYGKEM
jgi:hypothetical protein